MPELVTVQQLKNFLKIEFSDDDALIETLGNAAESYISDHLGISGSLSETLDTNGINVATIAVYQIVSNWYENRNINMGGSEMPHGGLHIINPLRDLL